MGVLKNRYGAVGTWAGLSFEGRFNFLRDPSAHEEEALAVETVRGRSSAEYLDVQRKKAASSDRNAEARDKAADARMVAEREKTVRERLKLERAKLKAAKKKPAAEAGEASS